MSLTVGSLFSGIGGFRFDLGLERAGMVVRWQCEIDPFCCRVLAKHWPDLPRYGDIREVDWHGVEPVDLMCGGPPCQPVSLAGRRGGSGDERWLWHEFFRAVRTLRPRYVVMENPTGILSAGFGGILGELVSCGYDAEWDCIPAAVVGAPHERNRIFVVAYPHGVGRFSRPVFAGIPTQAIAPQSAAGVPTGWWRGRLRQSSRGRVRLLPDGATDRVDDGFSTELDRLRMKALGNAVVPQVAEYVGGCILAMEAT